MAAGPNTPPRLPGRTHVPTTTRTATAEDLLTRYAADITFVAEAESPAGTLPALAHHLDTAASNFDLAGINGHEDIATAAGYINEAFMSCDVVERGVFLRKADCLLDPIVSEMVQEYRDMVGD